MLSEQDNELLCRTGPGTPMGELFRRFWVPALLPSELPEPDCPPVRIRLLSEDLVAFRDTGGRIGMLQAACPHRRVNLFFGRNEEHGLRCVYHGWKFDVEGNCVDMPNEPLESNFKHKVKTRAYPAEEWGGLVWAYMGPPELKPELPRYDWCLQPEDTRGPVSKWLQESNYAQGLEGNIDSAHVSFLHKWFDPSITTSRQYIVDGAPQLFVKETDFGFIYGARRTGPAGQYYWRITPFALPMFTTIPNPKVQGGGFWLVPQDDEHTWWFRAAAAPENLATPYVELMPGTWRQTRNRDNDYRIDREMQRKVNFTGLPTNRVQDAAVTESMGAIVDRRAERLGTTDAAIIFMRRLLIRTALQLREGIEPPILRRPELHGVLPVDTVSEEPSVDTVWDAHSPTAAGVSSDSLAPASHSSMGRSSSGRA